MINALKRVFSIGNSSSIPRSMPIAVEGLEKRELLSTSTVTANQTKIKVKNLFDSNDQHLNESLVTVPFTAPIEIASQSGIAVRGYILNPLTGSQKKVTIPVLDLSVATDKAGAGYLVIHTGVLMRKNGGKILISAGALTDAQSNPLPDIELSSPKGQNKERFTLAYRAFTPTDQTLFSSDLYSGAGSTTSASSHVSTNTVTTNFTAFMNKKVSMGLITQATENTALAQYNDATVQSIVPDANLRAAMLSLYGTVGQPAIDAMLNGDNQTGKPQTVVDFSTEVSSGADVAETLVVKGNRLRTLFKESYAGEPFEALSTWVAHEAMHQDTPDGQSEAIATNIVESMVWAQQLEVDSSYVNTHTALVKLENDKLYAMLNSGLTLFPRVGLDQAPLRTGTATDGVFDNSIVPGSGGAYQSYADYIQRIYAARGFAATDTAGNPTADAMINNITGLSKSYSTFSSTMVTDVDSNQQIITDPGAIKLAGILKLGLA